MTLIVKNTKALLKPEDFKLKILIYGLNGTGKTTFLSTVPDLGIGVSETGWGKGLLGVATKGLDYVEINSYEDYEQFCALGAFKDKTALGLDSLSDVNKTYIRAKALSLPRAKGESLKRQIGIPEIDDYGSMAELCRKNLRKLIDQNKHVIVTAALRIDKPDPDSMQSETMVGPDLPGQMFLGSTAMFDLVLCTRTRSVLPDKNNAKSRFTQYYYLTNNPGTGIIAKNRLGVEGGKSFLPAEIVMDINTGEGMFPWLLKTAQDAYVAYLKEHAVA